MITYEVISTDVAKFIEAVLINELKSIVTSVANIKGLWVFDQSGATATITDRSDAAHNVTLSGNASTLDPSTLPFPYYLDFNASTDYWDTPDHADFSFVEPAKFSIIALLNPNNVTASHIVAKNVETTGSKQQEYEFAFDGNRYLSMAMYDNNTGGYMSRYYNVQVTPDIGSWHVYGVTYSGSGASSGIKLYRDAVQVDNTSGSTVSYTSMRDTTAKVGNYFTNSAGSKARVGNSKYSVVMIVAEELTASQIKRITHLLQGFASVSF